MDNLTAFSPKIELPTPDCGLCPRLCAYRGKNRGDNPTGVNAPVASIGPEQARLLVVGALPAPQGANSTGDILKGDDEARLLRETLARFDLTGDASARLTLAVRCAAPANVATAAEVSVCNRFLRAELHALGNLRAVLALGVVAHAAVLRACGVPAARFRFRHGDIHALPDGLILANSHNLARFTSGAAPLPAELFAAIMLKLLRGLAAGETTSA